MNQEARKLQNGRTTVLLSNSLVCEASRFCAGKLDEDNRKHIMALTGRRRKLTHPVIPHVHRASLRVKRLLDFCSFVEACILADDIVVLSSVTPDDDASHYLQKHIQPEGFLHVRDARHLAATVEANLVSLVRNAEKGELTKYNPEWTDPFVAEIVHQTLTKQVGSCTGKFPHPRLYLDDREDEGHLKWLVDSDFATAGWWVDHLLVQDKDTPLEQRLVTNLGGHVANLISYGGSGTHEAGVSLVRTLAYICTSRELAIPFFPDAIRMPLVLSLNDVVKSSLSLRAYAILSKGLHCHAESLREFDAAIEVPLPPFAALALARAQRPEDLLTEVLSLRIAFKSFRENFSALQDSMRSAKSLTSMTRTKRRIERLFEAWSGKISRKFQPTGTVLDRAHYMLPDVADGLSSLQNVQAFGGKLASMGLGRLGEWWRTRPLQPLFNAMSTLEDMENYGSSLKRLFKWEITDDEIQDYGSLFASHLKLCGLAHEEEDREGKEE